MKFISSFFFIILLIMSCTKTKTINVSEIVNRSLEVSGGDKIGNATIQFTFRDKNYKAFRRFGHYQFERSFILEKDTIIDLLDNDQFERFINFKKVNLTDSLKNQLSKAVNSVHYFSVLPYGLNAEAVQKKYLGTTDVKGKKYYKIQVTFNPLNGGDDFEDVFIYWINSNTYKTDYLAYQYHVNQGGMRFREAFNERIINGIRFVDYKNYRPLSKDVSLVSLDRWYEKHQLKLISTIELKAIKVK